MVPVGILAGQARKGPASVSSSPRGSVSPVSPSRSVSPPAAVRVLDETLCYRAVCSRDRRFDGCFYTGVLTTGIYCRPSCPARTPKPANVRFFTTAAAAHGSGFRACKRCRPDAVPGSPEWSTRYDVVARAMRFIADGELDRTDVGGLAARLGYSERQLHRLLVAELGTGAVALARARRAETARVLLETTALDVTGVAFAAGFSSIRQFNATVREVFAMTPTEVRSSVKGRGLGAAGADGAIRSRQLGRDRTVSPYSGRKAREIGACQGTGSGPAPLVLRLPYREPFAAHELFGFLARRAVPGIESGTDHGYARTLALPHGPATVRLEAADGHVSCTLRLTDLRDLTAAVARVRRLLDLDADPVAVDSDLGRDPALGPLVRACPGRRSPGHVDPCELAVRAVIGQQVSVAAARGVTARLVRSLGSVLPPTLAAPDDGLTHLFPSPERLAEGDPDSGSLAVPAPRARAVVGLARALAEGRVVLDAGADPDRAISDLMALDGIGPWTAGYIRMRALGDPDVFLGNDLVIQRALARLGAPAAPDPPDSPGSGRRSGSPGPGSGSPGSGRRSGSPVPNGTVASGLGEDARWRPWRSYALHHLWAASGTTGGTHPSEQATRVGRESVVARAPTRPRLRPRSDPAPVERRDQS